MCIRDSREADFGSYPAGLMYGLQVLDSWLYDDALPFIHIEAGETYKALREKAETDYFEELIDKCMIHNTHKSILTPVSYTHLDVYKRQVWQPPDC